MQVEAQNEQSHGQPREVMIIWSAAKSQAGGQPVKIINARTRTGKQNAAAAAIGSAGNIAGGIPFSRSLSRSGECCLPFPDHDCVNGAAAFKHVGGKGCSVRPARSNMGLREQFPDEPGKGQCAAPV